jgi:predicted Zn finger-like uncharacterized protein
MKFTCESCSAQYMISDDKVGATGVKVRCKKCGNVITVRRAAEGSEAASAPPPSAPPSGDGLDAELGSAFDSAFGDRPPAPDLDATQAMEPDDAKRIADGPSPAPLSSEWYVAIGEAQVGPLPIADVKRKWEQGDIGPDSLCWRPGMGDWSPLSTVSELASILSPIPRQVARAAAAPKGGTPAFGTPAVPPVAPAAPASNAAPDATWKPAGASALAALASEELQARAAPAGEPAKPAAKPAGVKSLVEQMNLAEGGIEPTGALPLSIKGVERTDEKPIRRQSSVARGQEEIRQKRGMAKVVVGVVVAVVAIVAAGAFGVIKYLDTKLPANAVATAEPVAPVAPPPAAPPVQPPPQAAPPPAATPPAAEPPPAAPAAVAVAEPAAPPPPPAKAAKEAPVRVAKATPPPPTRVARREPEPEPEPAPPPKAAPKKKSDGLLDGIDGGGDDALADALGGGGSGRSVYVPPKPGGSAAALPDSISDGQVTEGIKGKFESLAECADKGSGSGATIVMQWDITPEGGTRGVKCKAPCGDPPVGTCLSSVIKSIRFPRSVSGRNRVEFPFKF